MTINPFEIEDFLGEARERVTEQFKGKVVLDKYLQLMLQSRTELQEVCRQLMQERSLDTAIGAQLDNLGAIVGQPRTLIDVDIYEFFGFKGVPNAGGFGTLDDPSIGAIFWDNTKPRFGNVTMSDEVYRLFIRAKIFKNITRATPEDVMDFANFVFETTGSTIQLEGSAHYTLMVGKNLSSYERSLLRYVDNNGNYPSTLMPKPVGVSAHYGQFDVENFFGFLGYPGAKGFGTYTYATFDGTYNYDGVLKYGPQLLPGVGGTFASLLDV